MKLASVQCTCSAKAMLMGGVWGDTCSGRITFTMFVILGAAIANIRPISDYIPATCDWQDGDQPADDSFYAWGPNVPEDFVHNYES